MGTKPTPAAPKSADKATLMSDIWQSPANAHLTKTMVGETTRIQKQLAFMQEMHPDMPNHSVLLVFDAKPVSQGMAFGPIAAFMGAPEGYSNEFAEKVGVAAMRNLLRQLDEEEDNSPADAQKP